MVKQRWFEALARRQDLSPVPEDIRILFKGRDSKVSPGWWRKEILPLYPHADGAFIKAFREQVYKERDKQLDELKHRRT
jgi:hypothetical protein